MYVNVFIFELESVKHVWAVEKCKPAGTFKFWGEDEVKTFSPRPSLLLHATTEIPRMGTDLPSDRRAPPSPSHSRTALFGSGLYSRAGFSACFGAPPDDWLCIKACQLMCVCVCVVDTGLLIFV